MPTSNKNDKVADFIKTTLTELYTEQAEDKDRLYLDLGMNSMEMTEFEYLVETKFDIDLENSFYTNLDTTVEDTIKATQAKLEELSV